MGPDGGFITGSDFLMNGGVTAAFWYGDLAEVRTAQGRQQLPLSGLAIALLRAENEQASDGIRQSYEIRAETSGNRER